MLNRSTVQLRAVESSTVKEMIDSAKRAEREGRWADACGLYERLVRDAEANPTTRLAALRWLGRALKSGAVSGRRPHRDDRSERWNRRDHSRRHSRCARSLPTQPPRLPGA